ncbi:TPA: VENN motif pre-toxin domain-containing protein, partial [Stenotrophomonas maltophilia]
TIGGKQTTAAELGINTDASAAHRALDALPDANKLLADQQAMAAGAGTVMATSQQIAWDVQAYQSKKATQAYYDGLSSDDQKAFNALSAEQRDTVLTANSQAYNDAKKWGDGGEYSRALGAVTTALVGGVAGQGAGQVASNALAPYAAYFIGSKLDSNHGSDPNAALQLLSHAVLGALLAEANGGSAGTGAVSAAGGELAAKVLTNTLTGGNPSELSPEQKEMVLALSQAVGALAGGLSGQDLAGIALNAGIAKNSVENNFLGNDDHARMVHLREKAKRQGGLDKQESLELVLLDAADQMSAGLLRKALAGETLTEVQAADLATYINRYELQNGPLDLPGLQRQFLANSGSLDPGELQGINPSQSYGRPYVGLGDDQKAYKDANYSWFEDLIYRDKGANERLYDAALKQSGLEITRSEDLLPSAMQLRNFFAVHDAQASSAIASAAFIAATLGGASEENRRALTLTMGALANIGAVRFVNRTGLLPQTGALGVPQGPGKGQQLGRESQRTELVLPAPSMVTVAPAKFDYIFGRVRSNEHNSARSTQLFVEMRRLGINDSAFGRKILIEHLDKVVRTEGNVVSSYSNEFGRFETRESLLIGPSGRAVMLRSSFQVMDDGTRKFSTFIPSR